MGISDDIKSGFYAGIGLMLKGKEKVEDVAREFIKDRNMNAEEGEKFVKDMVSKANETREEFEKYLNEKNTNYDRQNGICKKRRLRIDKKRIGRIKKFHKERTINIIFYLTVLFKETFKWLI